MGSSCSIVLRKIPTKIRRNQRKRQMIRHTLDNSENVIVLSIWLVIVVVVLLLLLLLFPFFVSPPLCPWTTEASSFSWLVYFKKTIVFVYCLIKINLGNVKIINKKNKCPR